MRRMRVSFRDHDTNRGLPIYEDVLQGRGGIAGGKFLFVNDAASITSIEHSGTVVSATANTVELASSASSTDDEYLNMSFQTTSGTGSGQDHQHITAYNGTTKVATLSADFTTTLDTTTGYRIVNRAS